MTDCLASLCCGQKGRIKARVALFFYHRFMKRRGRGGDHGGAGRPAGSVFEAYKGFPESPKDPPKGTRSERSRGFLDAVQRQNDQTDKLSSNSREGSASLSTEEGQEGEERAAGVKALKQAAGVQNAAVQAHVSRSSDPSSSRAASSFSDPAPVAKAPRRWWTQRLLPAYTKSRLRKLIRELRAQVKHLKQKNLRLRRRRCFRNPSFRDKVLVYSNLLGTCGVPAHALVEAAGLFQMLFFGRVLRSEPTGRVAASTMLDYLRVFGAAQKQAVIDQLRGHVRGGLFIATDGSNRQGGFDGCDVSFLDAETGDPRSEFLGFINSKGKAGEDTAAGTRELVDPVLEAAELTLAGAHGDRGASQLKAFEIIAEATERFIAEHSCEYHYLNIAAGVPFEMFHGAMNVACFEQFIYSCYYCINSDWELCRGLMIQELKSGSDVAAETLHGDYWPSKDPDAVALSLSKPKQPMKARWDSLANMTLWTDMWFPLVKEMMFQLQKRYPDLTNESSIGSIARRWCKMAENPEIMAEFYLITDFYETLWLPAVKAVAQPDPFYNCESKFRVLGRPGRVFAMLQQFRAILEDPTSLQWYEPMKDYVGETRTAQLINRFYELQKGKLSDNCAQYLSGMLLAYSIGDPVMKDTTVFALASHYNLLDEQQQQQMTEDAVALGEIFALTEAQMSGKERAAFETLVKPALANQQKLGELLAMDGRTLVMRVKAALPPARSTGRRKTKACPLDILLWTVSEQRASYSHNRSVERHFLEVDHVTRGKASIGGAQTEPKNPQGPRESLVNVEAKVRAKNLFHKVMMEQYLAKDPKHRPQRQGALKGKEDVAAAIEEMWARAPSEEMLLKMKSGVKESTLKRRVPRGNVGARVREMIAQDPESRVSREQLAEEGMLLESNVQVNMTCYPDQRCLRRRNNAFGAQSSKGRMGWLVKCTECGAEFHNKCAKSDERVPKSAKRTPPDFLCEECGGEKIPPKRRRKAGEGQGAKRRRIKQPKNQPAPEKPLTLEQRKMPRMPAGGAGESPAKRRKSPRTKK